MPEAMTRNIGRERCRKTPDGEWVRRELRCLAMCAPVTFDAYVKEPLVLSTPGASHTSEKRFDISR